MPGLSHKQLPAPAILNLEMFRATKILDSKGSGSGLKIVSVNIWERLDSPFYYPCSTSEQITPDFIICTQCRSLIFARQKNNQQYQ